MEGEPTLRQTLGSLLRLAWPLIVSNLFFTLQFSIDRLFLSWYDPTASGAAFAAAMVFYAPVTLLTTTAGFTATFVAQYLGAGRPQRVGPVVSQALWFGLGTGFAFMLLAPLSEAVLGLAGHEPELVRLEAEYLFCLAFCALPMTISAAVSGMIAGLHRPRAVIWINIVGCAVNAFLDWVLIFGNLGAPELGIAGAGWATVAGSYAAMAVALALWLDPGLRARYGTGRLIWDLDLAHQYLRFAFPNGVQACFDVIVWTIFTLLVGRLGAAALAATNIVLIVNAMFFVPMLGLAQAICVQVGRHLGEDRPDLAQRSVWLGFALAGSVMTVMGVVVALIPDLFLALFASDRDTNPSVWAEVTALVPMLLWFVAAYSFFDSVNLTFAFALRGAGDTRFVTVMTIACGVLLLIVPCYYVCEHGWGLFWAWVCATMYIGGLALTFLARFLWGPWREMRVIEPRVAEMIASNNLGVTRLPLRRHMPI